MSGVGRKLLGAAYATTNRAALEKEAKAAQNLVFESRMLKFGQPGTGLILMTLGLRRAAQKAKQ
jgi:hypothetical protein